MEGTERNNSKVYPAKYPVNGLTPINNKPKLPICNKTTFDNNIVTTMDSRDRHKLATEDYFQIEVSATEFSSHSKKHTRTPTDEMNLNAFYRPMEKMADSNAIPVIKLENCENSPNNRRIKITEQGSTCAGTPPSTLSGEIDRQCVSEIAINSSFSTSTLQPESVKRLAGYKSFNNHRNGISASCDRLVSGRSEIHLHKTTRKNHTQPDRSVLFSPGMFAFSKMVDAELLKWAHQNPQGLNYPIVQRKADSIARSLGSTRWQCNRTWLFRWKTRHGIKLEPIPKPATIVPQPSKRMNRSMRKQLVDAELLKWARQNPQNLNYNKIQQQAELITQRLGCPRWKSIKSWIFRWKTRHGIKLESLKVPKTQKICWQQVVDEELLKWAQQNPHRLNDLTIQEKAESIAESLGPESSEWKCDSTWVSRWKILHGIELQGETESAGTHADIYLAQTEQSSVSEDFLDIQSTPSTSTQADPIKPLSETSDSITDISVSFNGSLPEREPATLRIKSSDHCWKQLIDDELLKWAQLNLPRLNYLTIRQKAESIARSLGHPEWRCGLSWVFQWKTRWAIKLQPANTLNSSWNQQVRDELLKWAQRNLQGLDSLAVQQKAESIARSLGHPEWKCNRFWVMRWKTLSGIELQHSRKVNLTWKHLLDGELLKWAQHYSQRLTYLAVKQKAELIAESLGRPQWKCNRTWVFRWRTRHGIKFESQPKPVVISQSRTPNWGQVVDDELLKWAQQIPQKYNYQTVTQKAESIARSLGHPEWKCGPSWVLGWQKKHTKTLQPSNTLNWSSVSQLVEAELLKWAQQQNPLGLDDRTVQLKAESMAQSLGYQGWKCSTSWVNGWATRNGIRLPTDIKTRVPLKSSTFTTDNRTELTDETTNSSSISQIRTDTVQTPIVIELLEQENSVAHEPTSTETVQSGTEIERETEKETVNHEDATRSFDILRRYMNQIGETSLGDLLKWMENKVDPKNLQTEYSQKR